LEEKVSTKLYTGYRLPKMSLEQLQQFCLQIAKNTQDLAVNLYTTEIAERATRFIDYAATHNGRVLPSKQGDLKRGSYSRAWLEITDERCESERSGTRSSVDYGLEVCLIPGQEFVYAVLYGEDRMRAPWIAAQGVEFYPYWDNTDPLEGMTYEQWQDRRQEWGQVLGKDWTPGKVGFTFTLSSNDWLGIPTIREIRCHVPSFEERLLHAAEGLLFDEKCKQLAALSPDSKPGITLYLDLLRKIKEGSELASKIEEIKPLLKPVLSVEDFTQEYEVTSDLP
jgi:hypothetical protein